MDDGGFIEFTETYAGRLAVTKRGLDASPALLGKFQIARDEALVFTSRQSPRRALTAFHFHPDFPDDFRRAYMERHTGGRDALLASGAPERGSGALGALAARIAAAVSDLARGIRELAWGMLGSGGSASTTPVGAEMAKPIATKAAVGRRKRRRPGRRTAQRYGRGGRMSSLRG